MNEQKYEIYFETYDTSLLALKIGIITNAFELFAILVKSKDLLK